FQTRFTLACTGEAITGTMHATIISLQGKMLFAAEYPVAEKAEIRPGSLAPGIYVLRVFSGDRQAVLKIAVK
ncbi:MAG TPA: T9SS type A sorting domain-containing protein, partial [Bacteroidales bacterium]|nr:T9SS type A sorting domain-containing protein [Bacteroidales bacterium]